MFDVGTLCWLAGFDEVRTAVYRSLLAASTADDDLIQCPGDQSRRQALIYLDSQCSRLKLSIRQIRLVVIDRRVKTSRYTGLPDNQTVLFCTHVVDQVPMLRRL